MTNTILFLWIALVAGFRTVRGQGGLRRLLDNEPPPNDQCINAQRITTWSTNGAKPSIVAQGSTRQATEIQESESCGGRTSPGIWYALQGAGEEITVSTCSAGTDFDTVLSIFSGTANCGNLVCIKDNDDASPPNACTENRRASLASFQSVLGETYYILVRGFADGRIGDFDLTIGGKMLNDQCSTAHAVEVGGDPVEGDTSKSLPDLANLLDSACGYKEREYGGEWYHLYAPRTPHGLWYTVRGTGNILRATTCEEGRATTFHAHRIHVFDSTSTCGGSCIGGEISPRECVTYEWESSPGTTYYVVIHRTYSIYDTEYIPAPFQLTVSDVGGGGGGSAYSNPRRSEPSRGRSGPFD